jgi:phosphocarrier protein
MLSIDLEIRNPSGLHARPAAQFVRQAAAAKCRVRLANLARPGCEADGKSILGVLSLGVTKGTPVRLTVDGEDETTTIQELSALIVNGLGESVEP